MWQSNLKRIVFFGFSACMLLVSTVVSAQQVPSREKLNSGTVSIITGQPGYLSSRLASDLSAVLDEGDNLRVLAIAGRGAISDLIDTLLLRGIDLAVVPADVLEYVEKENLLPTLKSRLRFVTRLYNKAAHLVAGSGIKSLEDLRGKKVNIVSDYHGAFVVAQNVFKNANIDFIPVYLDQRLALSRVRSGEIAATLIMSGRPNPLLDEIRDGGPLKLIDIPFTDALPKTYFPIELTSADYPDLILPGQTIKTIATPSIMMVYNFPQGNPRRAKITRFIDAFLGRLPDLQRAPRHPRWRDVNLGAAIVGLERYQSVAQWLLTNKPPVVAAPSRPSGGAVACKICLRRSSLLSPQAAAPNSFCASISQNFLRASKRGRKTSAQHRPQAKPAPKSQVSLRVLFREFIDAEAARVGKDKVLALSKKELFDRFLVWRKQGGRPIADLRNRPTRRIPARLNSVRQAIVGLTMEVFEYAFSTISSHSPACRQRRLVSPSRQRLAVAQKKPMTMIVPYGKGGGSDQLSRAMVKVHRVDLRRKNSRSSTSRRCRAWRLPDS